MAEQKTYHVERYHWAFDFEKHPGGVYVTSTGPGIRKQPQDIQTADQALMYDPTDFQKSAVYRLSGRTHQLRHEYDEAIEEFMVSMIADPVDKEFWFRIGMLYGLQGDTAKQAAAFEQGRRAYAAQGEELPATAYIAMGDTLAAYEAARTMVKDERDPEDQYNRACILAQTGHHEEAISTLRRSLECGFSNFYHIAWDPDLDSLRELPEFVALINEFKQLAEQRKQRLHERIDTDLNY
jgi:tetratricopeptide (TPR) repeat protein